MGDKNKLQDVKNFQKKLKLPNLRCQFFDLK